MRLRFRQRLRLNRDFSRLRRVGVRTDAGPFVLFVGERATTEGLQQLGSGRSQFAVSMPARIGCAAVRNRIKRCFREAFRLAQAQLPQGMQFWVQVRADCSGWGVTETQARLISAIARGMRVWGGHRTRGQAQPS